MNTGFTDESVVVHDHEDHQHDDHGHGYTDWQYVVVAFVLAVITAIEVAVSYLDIGPLFLPTLLVLMAIKFITVVRLFMHLKFDSKIFSWMFFSGLLLALGVYLAMLAAFHMFTG
jgi:heme/copper-type cytochrome/quinol oxidase subunit 4